MSKSSSRNPMDLVDRYLQAVRFWLPKGQEHDIVAELSEDLHSAIDEKETQLGRQVNDDEVDELLRRRGHPVVMANRYMPQQHLIGPVLFPIYRLVLKIVCLFYLVPWILVWGGLMLFDATYRTQHISAGWGNALGSAFSAWFSIAAAAVGTVTIVFAALEWAHSKSPFFANWSPRKLPVVRDTNRIPRSGSVIEVAINVVFCVWWASYLYSNVLVDRPELRVVLSSVWHYFFWSMLLLGAGNAVLAAVNLLNPYWTRTRATFRFASNALGSAWFCCLLKTSILAQITVTGSSAARTLDITNAINLWMAKAFPIALIVGVMIAAVDAYRIYRVKPPRTRVQQSIAASIV